MSTAECQSNSELEIILKMPAAHNLQAIFVLEHVVFKHLIERSAITVHTRLQREPVVLSDTVSLSSTDCAPVGVNAAAEDVVRDIAHKFEILELFFPIQMYTRQV